MMRRYAFQRLSGLAIATRFCSSAQGSSVPPPSGVGLGLKSEEDKPHPLSERKVKFVTAGSLEGSPRAAASEAFDTAVAALDHKPNFCWFYVSLDSTQMTEAPEVLWNELCLLHGTEVGKKPPANVGMVGAALSKQKIDGSYVRVLMGSIPDLEVQPFTFNELPTLDPEQEAKRPPPFFCMVNVDTMLQLKHQEVIASHLQTLHERLGRKVPIAGTVLSPQLPPLDMQTSNDVPLGEGMSYLNDALYTGSANGVLLRSKMVEASVISSRPSIVLEGPCKVTKVQSVESDGVKRFVISEFEGGRRATDAVKNVYETHLQENKRSKVFIGVKSTEEKVDGSMIPVSFTGDPEAGTLTLDALPPSMTLKEGDAIHLVCDDAELDTEALARTLMSFDKTFLGEEARRLSKTETITVPREAARKLTVASSTCIHFSNPGLNQKAVPTNGVLLRSTAHAPSIATRIFGQDLPCIGAFGPGQIAPVLDVLPQKEGEEKNRRSEVSPPLVSLRSAAHVFLRGLE